MSQGLLFEALRSGGAEPAAPTRRTQPGRASGDAPQPIATRPHPRPRPAVAPGGAESRRRALKLLGHETAPAAPARRETGVRTDGAAPEVPFVRGVLRGLAPTEKPDGFGLALFTGRLCEVSGSRSGASLTFAFRLVHEAQRRGEPVAWVASSGSAFFPPDVAASGVDLGALAVVRVAGTVAAARAAEHVLRSGAFGVVAVDLGPELRLPLHVQTRLASLAKKHGVAAVCITEKDDDHPSLGSLVSLRVHTARAGGEGERFRCEARALKDKRRGPGQRHAQLYRGPDGLR